MVVSRAALILVSNRMAALGLSPMLAMNLYLLL